MLIPSGAAPHQPARLADLLDALRLHEPDCPLVVVVDDGQPPGALQAVLDRAGFPHRVLPNARAGRGWGWGGGLTCGLHAALRQIWRERSPDFVVKLDTDALTLGPFAREVGERLARHPSAGLLGRVVHLTPRECRRVRRLTLPVSLWRQPRLHLRWGAPFSRSARELNQCLHRAAARDRWRSPVPQGGAYVLARPFLDAMDRGGWWDDPTRFLHVQLPEDILHSYLNRGFGLDALDAADLFASHCSPLEDWQTLPGTGVRIVHPVRDWPGRTDEAPMRAFFREHRESAGRGRFAAR